MDENLKRIKKWILICVIAVVVLFVCGYLYEYSNSKDIVILCDITASLDNEWFGDGSTNREKAKQLALACREHALHSEYNRVKLYSLGAKKGEDKIYDIIKNVENFNFNEREEGSDYLGAIESLGGILKDSKRNNRFFLIIIGDLVHQTPDYDDDFDMWYYPFNSSSSSERKSKVFEEVTIILIYPQGTYPSDINKELIEDPYPDEWKKWWMDYFKRNGATEIYPLSFDDAGNFLLEHKFISADDLEL